MARAELFAVPLARTYSGVALGTPGAPQVAEMEVEAEIAVETTPPTAYADEEADWRIERIRIRELDPAGNESWAEPGDTLGRLLREWLERHALPRIEDAVAAELAEAA